MTQVAEEKKGSSTGPTKVVSQDTYLKEHFPVGTGEYRVDYKPVGENRFRINFWSYRDKPGSSTFSRDSYISRSHYVILERKDVSWSHKVLKP